MLEIVNPDSLAPARGWSHGMIAPEGSRLLLVAGQTASDQTGAVAPRPFLEQFGQVLANILTIVREAGGGPESIGRMTAYVTDMPTYRAGLEELGAVWREHMGRHYPTMALVAVTELVDENALVEIEATAILPAATAQGGESNRSVD